MGLRVELKAEPKSSAASVDARWSVLRDGRLLPLMDRILANGLNGQGLSPLTEGLLPLFSFSSSTI